MNKDMYVFIGWFFPVRCKDDVIITCVEVSKIEFLKLIDDCVFFAKSNNYQLHARKVFDEDLLHIDFLLDDYVFGFAEYRLFDDDDLGVIVDE